MLCRLNSWKGDSKLKWKRGRSGTDKTNQLVFLAFAAQNECYLTGRLQVLRRGCNENGIKSMAVKEKN